MPDSLLLVCGCRSQEILVTKLHSGRVHLSRALGILEEIRAFFAASYVSFAGCNSRYLWTLRFDTSWRFDLIPLGASIWYLLALRFDTSCRFDLIPLGDSIWYLLALRFDTSWLFDLIPLAASIWYLLALRFDTSWLFVLSCGKLFQVTLNANSRAMIYLQDWAGTAWTEGHLPLSAYDRMRIFSASAESSLLPFRLRQYHVSAMASWRMVFQSFSRFIREQLY